jgi:putative Holliday junction resolvase
MIHDFKLWSKIVGAYSHPEFFGMSKILGIDYGTVRVGLALTDSARIIAAPLTTVERKVLWDYLEKLITQEKISDVVVGEAKRLNGESSEITQLQLEFVASLAKRFPELTIHRENEMFTSKMATQAMLTSGMKKSDRQNKGNVDMISAAILLQSFLDRR